MSEIRKSMEEFDELINKADELKGKIATFRVTHTDLSTKQRTTLQFLESAADHILDNLFKMKQRVLIDLGGE